MKKLYEKQEVREKLCFNLREFCQMEQNKSSGKGNWWTTFWGTNHKQLLFIISISFLLSYGCSNKNNSGSVNSGTKPDINSNNSEKIKKNDEKATKTFSSIYSLDADRMDEKNLLKQYHDRYKNEVNLDLLKQQLNSSDLGERQDAVKILSYFPEYSSLVPKIEKLLLEDNSTDVRKECAATLQLMESKQSIPALIKALKDNNIEVKTSSMEALAALGEKKQSFIAANELWNNGKDGATVLSCHFAFRDIGTPEAVERLRYDMNNNTDNNLAIDAAIILTQLGFSDETLPFFEQSLKNEDEYIRMAALRGLAYVGNESALKLIRSKLDDSNELVKERAESIIKNI